MARGGQLRQSTGAGGGGELTSGTSQVAERDCLTFQAPLMPLLPEPVLRSLGHSVFELLLRDLENVGHLT